MSVDIQIYSTLGSFALGQHDIVFDAVGRVVSLTGRDKLIQDIQKILFTNVNKFYNQYGTQLDSFIGTNYGVDQTINLLGQKVTDSLLYLQYLQDQQSTYQQVQGSEIIQQILELNIDYLYAVTNNEDDLTTFSVGIVILSGDNQLITVGADITLA
jgi:hypothetical protein